MHLWLRRLSVLFAVALMAGLLPTSVLAAQPLLTGEILSYSNSRSGPGTPGNDIGALAMTTTCGPDDTGSFGSLQANGNAYGPHPGLFTVHDSFGGMTGAVVESLELNFEIHSVGGVNIATGVVAFDPDVAGDGTCYSFDREGDLPNTIEHIEVWQASGRATYRANVGGSPTEEVGYVSWDVACINIDYETACDSSETVDITFLGASIPRNASGDGSAQTAPAATAADPIATTVVSPDDGRVNIRESAIQPNNTDAYVFLGRQVIVSVENEDGDDLAASADAPIRLTFMIDVSVLTGVDLQTVTVLRDEVPAPNCTSPNPATGLTNPESFCVLSRTVAGDGDLTLEILSLHASTWSVVAPNSLPQYTFTGFSKPVDNPGANATRNVVKAGQSVPLGWRLTKPDGAPVLNLGSAQISVVGFNCGQSSSVDLLEEVATGSSGLQNLGNGYYQYNWKSPKSYANSCKELTLTLSVDGQTITSTALFQFKK